jgi:hypothetical protein
VTNRFGTKAGLGGSIAILVLACSWTACGGSDGGDDGENVNNDGAGAGSGSGNSSGEGGGILSGSGGNGTGGDESCASSTVVAEAVEAPADIIWIVDQSGSMDQETQYVQAKINDFATLIEQSGVDYRVVMIADPNSGNAICVPPPLAGAGCGDGPKFRLVPEQVGSNDGPEIALATYDQYSDFLRPEATKHLVFVTDDNSDMSAADFLTGLQALAPAGMFDSVYVHGIYAFGNGDNGCDGPFGSGAQEGEVYTALVAQTMGAAGVICEDDWSTVFTEISTAVLAGSQVPCELAIPEPAEGETLDTGKVNVTYQSGSGPKQTLPRVMDEASCGSTGGWYYDDNANPTTILLCSDICATIEADIDASVSIVIGCGTVTAD